MTQSAYVLAPLNPALAEITNDRAAEEEAQQHFNAVYSAREISLLQARRHSEAVCYGSWYEVIAYFFFYF